MDSLILSKDKSLPSKCDLTKTEVLRKHLEKIHQIIDIKFNECVKKYDEEQTTKWVEQLQNFDHISDCETASSEALHKYFVSSMLANRQQKLVIQSKSDSNLNIKTSSRFVDTVRKNKSNKNTPGQIRVDTTQFNVTPQWSTDDISEDSSNYSDSVADSWNKIYKPFKIKSSFGVLMSVSDKLIETYRIDCQMLNSRPLKLVISRIDKLASTGIMDLSELHLSELRFKPVANLIKKCSTLERLDLSYNNFGNVGVSLVDTILDEFAFLTYVNLSGNPMDQEACKLIQSILTKNTQLNTLILKDAKINDDGAVAIANGLRMNTRLTKLDLSKNNIMSDGASGLAKALTNSICLKWLSLHWNHIRAQGASEFGNTLEFNTSIQYLDLSWNGFNGKTLEKLGRGLKRNCHLEELNLKYNRIDLKSVIGFADCLYTNKTLKRLLIGLNPLTIAGIHDLVDVIEKSSTCVLEELDLEGLTINENISQQVFRINRRRHFTLKAENCIKWEPRRGKYSKTDPVTFLINYLNRHGMRLLDLYHLLDPQQAGVISSAQFTERMIKSEIPLTPDDLQTLIKYIDPDDTDRITYKLLASRIYFFRISVGEQLRIKAAEFSKHQLDQTRLFVRPEGLSDINRPPKGFPSKMKTSAKNSKKQENSSKPTKTGIFRVSKNAKISNTTQSKKNLEANSLEKRQQNASNSSTKCGKNVKTDVRGNKSTRNPLIKERLNFNSESDSVCGKESSVKSLQLKFTPSNIEEYKHFDKTSCDTTNIKRVQVIPISEVFEKKYF